ncbi:MULTISPECIES: beta-N-acetylglucosaminidase domain-containing protein [unclassified Streptomyces]|uniref:Beta-N-acetylglucosaminidase domain-containing protein n=1 Tax=Streptomyces sp. NBC_00119 TaxID=2975659 RepID=A0AAU1UF40_9ACTN|nr:MULTISPECIES: beta-N-acetylglucosaminidase domain-containing protein [unclassified Streptomyces]MCX4645423.1 beta-N-acetylglucosaminidase domain-containing protein [Streptomyces sp. NBC_01446]MCX5325809.1 beta-N-acetylglucosaminidase domain-containing protein [Streptomyces sp. NBC_00120]
MQLRRHRKGAAAIAVAVIASALGGASGAVAAPPGHPLSTGDRDSETGTPAVWPRPQSLRTASGAESVTVTDEVVLVTGRGADRYAVDALRTVLRGAGARHITEVDDGSSLPATPALVVRIGSVAAGTAAGDGWGAADARPGRGQGLETALGALGASARKDLPSGGYRLAVGRTDGRDTVAMEGVGDDGLFHAVQTFRQLVSGHKVAGVVVRDWPGTAVRGLTEGFYGTPWTREQRLDQIDFMGRTKQNRYLYAPGDDLYRQARWRETYPAAQRADFRALAERARANHVTLSWAVAPGQAMCMSSDDDVRALNRKLDAMWALGVRAFQLQFQDVSYSEWHCEADARTFGSGPKAAARAQARVANAVARHLAARHPGTGPLSLMPTEFYQDGSTEYRGALAGRLDDSVEVAWTGVGVVPRTITGRELAGARAAFGSAHDLVTMDNYPVNDYAQDRIFLGPYTGREPAVATGSAALLANAMEQPAASRIPLFTTADYAWNPRDYRPQESWKAAIDDLAGGDAPTREALGALAGNDASSVLGEDESAYLKPVVSGFWDSRTTVVTDRARYEAAAKKLRDAFTVMRRTPERLESTPVDAEVRPWSDQLARYGEAGETAVDMLDAQARGDGAAAWRAARLLERRRAALESRQVTVGKGVLDPFLDRAQKAYAAWAGTGRADATRDGEAKLPRARRLTAVTVLADPGTQGTVQVHEPGEGWKSVGTLTDSGFTERRPKDVRADAIRVTGAEKGAVRHVVPWYADSPDASFELARTELDAEIGGGARRVTAHLTSQRPGSVEGRLRAKGPHGIKVALPAQASLPRGTQVSAPVDITVPEGTPAGTYDVPVSFAGTTRTVSVRAYPRTAGPDLAREGRPSSSADETTDFPASAASDGDPETRWSSPAEDGAWWQVELAKPVRLGQVVLTWQDAYAKGYRIQTSADGRSWRTAATVKDGQGGRESVRMDARDTRFVRVQGDKRATRYGYSLWSVEAYAVAE